MASFAGERLIDPSAQNLSFLGSSIQHVRDGYYILCSVQASMLSLISHLFFIMDEIDGFKVVKSRSRGGLQVGGELSTQSGFELET